jgi:L-alanine-DL-glutamate epimerase-like enolase superfamily enzyme
MCEWLYSCDRRDFDNGLKIASTNGSRQLVRLAHSAAAFQHMLDCELQIPFVEIAHAATAAVAQAVSGSSARYAPTRPTMSATIFR